jgi:oligoendopeptidase F
MTMTEQQRADDLAANHVAWRLDDLIGDGSPDELVDRAEQLAANLQRFRGRVATLDVAEMATLIEELAAISDLLGRAGTYVGLAFSENTADQASGAAMQRITERSTSLSTTLLFVDLEWSAATDDHAAAILADQRLAPARHYLENIRRARPHQLSEPEEVVLSESSVVGASAWVRLFEETTSVIEVDLPEISETPIPLAQGLALLQSPERETRAAAAAAVTAALAPGLRTRAYIYNTLLLNRSVSDKLRAYPSWISSRNLDNEASDSSVQALVDAVVARYDIPQRWYRLKAQLLGIERIADFDRMSSVATGNTLIGWEDATGIVRDAYASFSPELASIVGRFIDEDWIDAPMRPGKRGGAFCAYGTPSVHPYVLLNWTSRHRDVLTLAHELGHGVHGYLAREQGIFHQSTPLTLAETASVFGETVTNNRLLAHLDDPSDRFALLASTLEDSIATVFRQVAMNRFEHACHTARRTTGELSVEQFGDFWYDTQHDMMGDSVELTEGYRTWWSYIPHFIATPGYVYAYAYGQLLALSVYARFEEQGDAFVPAYLDLLRAGGSRSPEELGKIVGCDLADPSFWANGLTIVERQLEAAEQAARLAGRI